MKFSDLVPPWDLCKKIPAGEFEDSAFLWHHTKINEIIGSRPSGYREIIASQLILEPSTPEILHDLIQRGEKVHPAPTLQEIIVKFDAFELYNIDAEFWDKPDNPEFGITEDKEECYYLSYDANPATAALQMWLKQKGIKK